MYGYEEHIYLSPEQILQKVSQQAIFELVLQDRFSFLRQYRSPLRADKHAGCRFEERPDGTILWVDFGDKKQIHRSCFKMVMDYYNESLLGAIRLISNHFQISTDPSDYSLIEPTNSYKNSYQDNKRVDISTNRVPFESKDKIFWNSAIISTDDLEQDNVYSSNTIQIFNPSKSDKAIKFFVYGLCYSIDFFDAIKIYQPYSINYKWITNCTENHIGNIDNLPATGDKLVICKAYKDHRTFRNLNLGTSYNFIWLHNEGSIPSLDILLNLTSRFKQIIVFYDNDYKGISAGYRLVSILNELKPKIADMKYIPLKYSQKDISEFVGKEGRKDTIKLINQIKL